MKSKIAKIFVAFVAFFLALFFPLNAGAQSAYQTITDPQSGLCIRAFVDPMSRYPAGTWIDENGWTNLMYQPGLREEEPEARVDAFPTNAFAAGKVKLLVRLLSNNRNRGPNAKYTDNNAWVLATMHPNGTVGQVQKSFIDTSNGVFEDNGNFLAKYGAGGWDGISENIEVELDLASPTALIFLGRPAVMDVLPEASLILQFKLVEGNVLRGPMIGDNQVWLTRPARLDQLLSDVRNAEPREIIIPHTGEMVSSRDAKISRILKVKSWDPAWNLMNAALMAQLRAVVENYDPFIVSLGQTRPLGSQLFFSAEVTGHYDEIVMHGGCTIGGLAVNLSRAYKLWLTDRARYQSDLNGCLAYLNYLYSR